MAKKRKPRAPGALGRRSLGFWHRVTDKYEFRADELRLLEDACREMTLIDRMDLELRNGPLMLTGSMGQPTQHPLLGEIRAHRTILARLLKQLEIPDEDVVAVDEPRSVQARDAAKSRWAVHHGEAI